MILKLSANERNIYIKMHFKRKYHEKFTLKNSILKMTLRTCIGLWSQNTIIFYIKKRLFSMVNNRMRMTMTASNMTVESQICRKYRKMYRLLLPITKNKISKKNTLLQKSM